MKHGKPVAVVTGATSGIGYETALAFAKKGFAVVGAARRIDRLNELKQAIEKTGGTCLTFPIDLSVPDKAGELIDAAMEKFGRIDVLVNNAGYGKQIKFDEMSYEQIEGMIRLDVLALMELSRKAVPIMKAQKDGSIINISSIAGFMPYPLNAVYCGAKFAVAGFSKSLRLELMGTGVRVTTVCPGATVTEFFENAMDEIPAPKIIMATAVPAFKVAQTIVEASRENKAMVYPAWSARFLAYVERFAPFAASAGNIIYRNSAVGKP